MGETLVQLVHLVNAFCQPRFAFEKFPQAGVGARPQSKLGAAYSAPDGA
jgi:hypothetical protein